MVQIYSSPSLATIHNIKNILENNGIETEIQGDKRASGIGELPPTECWYELWLKDKSQAVKATHLINKIVNEEEDGEPWNCECGEKLEPQFEICWSCGVERKE